MKILFHLLRSGALGAFVALAFFGMMVSAAEHPAEAGKPFVFALYGAIFGLATAVLLLTFRVGPVAKVFVGMFCGPVLPVLLLTNQVIAEGKAKDLGGLVFLCFVIGLLVGGLDASRIWQRRKSVEVI